MIVLTAKILILYNVPVSKFNMLNLSELYNVPVSKFNMLSSDKLSATYYFGVANVNVFTVASNKEFCFQ